jgi:hypothetical protein
MLFHVVGGDEQPRQHLALDADRPDLAPRILERRARVAGELRDREELRVVGRQTRTDRDVARRQRLRVAELT